MSTRYALAKVDLVKRVGRGPAACFDLLWSMRDASSDRVTVSLDALAVGSECSVRQVQRDLSRLRLIGAIVKDREHDPATGYVTASSYRLVWLDMKRRLVEVLAAMAGRSARAVERAKRRAEQLERYRLPTGQFGPRSISASKLQGWLHPIMGIEERRSPLLERILRGKP